MRRVRIEGNSIRKRSPLWARGIVVGLLDHRPSSAQFTVFYEDVYVSDNDVDLTTDEPRSEPAGEQSTTADERARVAGIWLQAHRAAPESPPVTEFRYAKVTDNLVRGARVDAGGQGAGIVAWNLRDSEVAGNGIYEADDGIVLAGVLLDTHVHDNRVEAGSAPYRFGVSIGGNHFGSNARLDIDSQRVIWRWEETDPSDQFEGDEFAGGQGLIGGV